jgi:hypothetical protein
VRWSSKILVSIDLGFFLLASAFEFCAPADRRESVALWRLSTDYLYLEVISFVERGFEPAARRSRRKSGRPGRLDRYRDNADRAAAAKLGLASRERGL